MLTDVLCINEGSGKLRACHILEILRMQFLSRGNTDGEILAFCLSPALLQLWQFLEFWPHIFLLPTPQGTGDFKVQEDVVVVTIGLHKESSITNTLWYTLSSCNETFQNAFIEFVSQTLWYDSRGAAKLVWNNPFFSQELQCRFFSQTLFLALKIRGCSLAALP